MPVLWVRASDVCLSLSFVTLSSLFLFFSPNISQCLHSFYRPAFGCILTPLFAKSFLCEVCQPGKHVVMMRPDLLSCSCWLQTSLFHCPSPPPISLIISRSLGRHRREHLRQCVCGRALWPPICSSLFSE